MKQQHTKHYFHPVINDLFCALESRPVIRAIRSGLTMIIPILLIGSFSLVIQYFPIIQYQHFVNSLWNGNFLAFLKLIYNATFGMLSVFLTLTVSYCYTRERFHKGGELCATLTSLIGFFIFSGVLQNNWDSLGAKGMSVAILSALICTRLYWFFGDRLNRAERPYMESSDTDFNSALLMITPAIMTCLLLTLVDLILIRSFRVDSFYSLFSRLTNLVFHPFGRSYLSSFLFVLISSTLWFFGIHGSDSLEPVMQELFTPALQINLDLTAAGQAPTEIFTKPFFDVFVLMGGCGTSICLLLALLLFSRRYSNRELSRLALVPMLFNINEIMIFGLPVAFNVSMLIPFLLTPLVTLTVSYTAMRLGIVPLVTSEVNWTIPVILGGYKATGSLAGSVLQLVNIIIGVLIYRPFVLAYDRRRDKEMVSLLDSLIDTLKTSESTLVPVNLSELPDKRGSMARALQKDIIYFIKHDTMPIFYQPQFDTGLNSVGAEALLRWKHPIYGALYPPLIIQLAREAGILEQMEIRVLKQAAADCAHIQKLTVSPFKISVNVSASTLSNPAYMDCLKDLMHSGLINRGSICLEITEQTALIQDDCLTDRLCEIRSMGYLLAIDDFSMGHTSISYLQRNQFDIIKLDGHLIREMESNPRSSDIVKNIVSLSKALGFLVLAEYVETEKQRKALEDLGCYLYQGFLVSPAIPLNQLEQLVTQS